MAKKKLKDGTKEFKKFQDTTKKGSKVRTATKQEKEEARTRKDMGIKGAEKLLKLRGSTELNTKRARGDK